MKNTTTTTALMLALAATPVMAQDAAPEQDAELAFLRAYYLEKGLDDLDAAEALYADVAQRFASNRDVVAKSLVGRFRCLDALGRSAEAAAVRTSLEADFQDKPLLLARLRSPDRAAPRPGPSVAVLVNRALTLDDGTWKAAVLRFGEPAVPVLAQTLRVADPAQVSRAAEALTAMKSDAAHDELAAALLDRDVLYPAQVDLGIRSANRGAISDRLGRAIVALPDAARRDQFILRALQHTTLQAWIVDAMTQHAWARDLVFGNEFVPGGIGTAIVGACARGPGPARDAALAYAASTLEALQSSSQNPPNIGGWRSALYDTPSAFLADGEALDAVSRVLQHMKGNPIPAKFRIAALRRPALRSIALDWMWFGSPAPELLDADREAFLAALSGDDWGAEGSQRHRTAIVKMAVGGLLGKTPTEAEVRLVVDHWPSAEKPGFGGYLQELIDSGHVDEAWLDRLLAGTSVPRRVEWVLRTIAAAGTKLDAAWATAVFARHTDHEDSEVRRWAVHGLGAAAPRANVDLRPYADAIGMLLDTGGTHDAATGAEMLLPLGEDGWRVLARHLEPGTDVTVLLAQALRDAEGAEVESALLRVVQADVAKENEVNAATQSLLVIGGGGAVPRLLDTARAGDSKRATAIVRGMISQTAQLDPHAAEIILRAVIAGAPRLPVSMHVPMLPLLARLPVETRREVVRIALASTEQDVRAWGARQAIALVDPAAEELLAERARDVDVPTRMAARKALDALRKAEQEAAWLQRAAERRRTLDKIEALLNDGNPRARQAGIAGLVAVQRPDAMERLLAIAIDDPDEEVAAEARRALMSLGRTTGHPTPSDE